MALQVLPTPPSVGEGYSRLGDALLQGSRDYMTQKLADDREARLRQQQLADVAAQNARQDTQIAGTRAYQDTRYGIERTDKYNDQQAAADAAQRRADLERMIQAGYITPLDAQDPQKLQAAYVKAQQDGIITKYTPLIAGGYLNAAEATDPDAVARALNTQGEETANTRKTALDEKENAAQNITKLEQQKQALQARSSELDQTLSTQTPPPTDQQVRAYATQKAQQLLAGKSAHWYGGGPAKASEEQIAAQMDGAKAELTDLVKTSDFQRKQNAAIQKELIQNQLRDTQAQQADLVRTFHVAPSASALQAAPAAIPAPAGASLTPVSQASPDQLAKVRAAALAAAAGTPPPSANMVGLRTPTEYQPVATANITDPESLQIANTENTRRAGLAHQLLIEQPIQTAQSQLADIDQQIAKVKTAKPPSAPAYMGGYMGGAGSYTAPFDPGAKATKLASLFNQRAAAQKQLTDLQARLQPAPLPATQPVTLNAGTNAPVFADPIQPDTSAMGTGRTAPWTQNQFNIQPAAY